MIEIRYFLVGNERIVNLLIENGANANLANDEGKTALHTAATHGNY